MTTARKPRRHRQYPLKGDTWSDGPGLEVTITDAGLIHQRQTDRIVKARRGRSTLVYTLAVFLRRFKLVRRHPDHASHRPSPEDRLEAACERLAKAIAPARTCDLATAIERAAGMAEKMGEADALLHLRLAIEFGDEAPFKDP